MWILFSFGSVCASALYGKIYSTLKESDAQQSECVLWLYIYALFSILQELKRPNMTKQSLNGCLNWQKTLISDKLPKKKNEWGKRQSVNIVLNIP